MNTFIENDFIKIWIENNVLIGTFLTDNVDEKTILFMIDSKKNLVNNEVMPILTDASNIKCFTCKAKELFSKKYTGENCRASAIIVKSKVQVVIFNFINAIYKTEVPTKIFSDKNLAIEWLKSFQSKNAKTN